MEAYIEEVILDEDGSLIKRVISAGEDLKPKAGQMLTVYYDGVYASGSRVTSTSY